MRLLPVLVALLAAPPLARGDHDAFTGEGIFATAAGASDATAAVEGLCAPSPMLTLSLSPRTPGAPAGTRVAHLKHVRAPDHCPVAMELPRAWSWTLVGLHVVIEGEVVSRGAGEAAYAFEGRFEEGALAFSGAAPPGAGP